MDRTIVIAPLVGRLVAVPSAPEQSLLWVPGRWGCLELQPQTGLMRWVPAVVQVYESLSSCTTA
jgi:hypothetical protein